MSSLPRSALVLALFIAPVTAAAQDSITSRVDAVFSAFQRPGAPGCALGVYRDGRMHYTRGFGLASTADSSPITSKTIFDIGSSGKQFTAASVILLAQQGKLSLDDDVRRFIPELPRYQKPITIRHLLHHTSGLRDYISLLTLGGADINGRTTAKDALDAIARQKALNFEPGSEHLYSNSGYFLLSQVVERASGKSMRAFAEEHIFRPLGMTSTHYRTDHSVPLPGLAMAYSPSPGGGFQVNMSRWEQAGDGAVFTTVEDLLRWDNNFYEPKVGGQRLLDELHRTGKLENGNPLTYASGLIVDEFRGLRIVSHGGSWGGYRAELIRFPQHRLSVAALCNVANAGPSALARNVASIYLADRMSPAAVQASAPAARPVVTLTDAQLQEWAGNYISTANGSPRVLAVENGKLMATAGAQRVELIPHGPAEFSTTLGVNNILLRFERGAEGRSIRQWIGTQEGPTFVEQRTMEPLSAIYAGTYRSEELAASFTIEMAEEAIRVKLPNGSTATMRRIRDGVFLAGGTTLRFDQPKDGRIEGFALDQGRVRGIRFVRTAD